MHSGANTRQGVEAASWLPMGFNRAEEPREVRYLRVISEPLGEDDDAVLEFSVHCALEIRCQLSRRDRFRGRSAPREATRAGGIGRRGLQKRARIPSQLSYKLSF
jgi:hypothetical protein